MIGSMLCITCMNVCVCVCVRRTGNNKVTGTVGPVFVLQPSQQRSTAGSVTWRLCHAIRPSAIVLITLLNAYHPRLHPETRLP
jgi:hypothetical protein